MTSPPSFCVPIIGDAHFKSDARQPDRLASVDQILEECIDQQVNLWAIPGDLFDAGSDVASRNAWADRIQTMADVAPVLICYGNHDRNGDLYLLSKVKGRWPVYVYDRPQTADFAGPYGLIRVFVLPYPYPSGLVAAGVAVGDAVSVARELLDVHFMEASALLHQARQEGRPTLFVGHANVGGSKMSTGQPLIGREIELDEGLLVRLGDCPKILNHIHLPQEIGGAWLTGSVTAMSWGETEAKRYLRVDYRYQYDGLVNGFTDIQAAAGRWTWDVVSCPLRTPKLVLVEATFADMEFRYDQDPDTVEAGSDVRVRVRFQESERQFFEYGRVQVQEAFQHARRLAIEPICEADKGLRSPEVAAAQTLAEKLRAWSAVSGETPPDGLVEAIAELEQRSSDEVIAAHRARMAALLLGE
jgi:DNA repair exonuclease SbcCD nuclease subunit